MVGGKDDVNKKTTRKQQKKDDEDKTGIGSKYIMHMYGGTLTMYSHIPYN